MTKITRLKTHKKRMAYSRDNSKALIIHIHINKARIIRKMHKTHSDPDLFYSYAIKILLRRAVHELGQ